MALLLTSCATLYPPHAGCERVGTMDGYDVMECAHPFAVLNGKPKECAYSTLQPSSSHGPYLPCGWVPAYTSRAERTVYFWEQSPESLAHERLHVLRLIPDED